MPQNLQDPAGSSSKACGWYLCAALHNDPLETWLARRLVGVNEDHPRSPWCRAPGLATEGPGPSLPDPSEEMLLNCSPFDQWAHSMYFVFAAARRGRTERCFGMWGMWTLKARGCVGSLCKHGDVLNSNKIRS